MSFRPADRRRAKLRIAVTGASGSGKTYSSLVLAKLLGDRIAVVDSERGSAEKYADAKGLPRFDVAVLEEKTIEEYRQRIADAAKAKYDVLVLDSLTHAWLATLELVDRSGGNKFASGWKHASPMWTKLNDDILSFSGHVIATMRSKTEYVIEQDGRGKAVPRKVGMAPVIRDGAEYEFDAVLDLSVGGDLVVSKSRCSELTEQAFTRADVPRIGALLKAWVESGSVPSAADEMIARVRAASSLDVLAGLISEIAKLNEPDRATLRPVYVARKAALTPPAEPAPESQSRQSKPDIPEGTKAYVSADTKAFREYATGER